GPSTDASVDSPELAAARATQPEDSFDPDDPFPDQTPIVAHTGVPSGRPKAERSADTAKRVPELGRILIDQGAVTQADVLKALRHPGLRLGEALVRSGVVDQATVDAALVKQKELCEARAAMLGAE